jgi:hypothetical protein
MSQNEGMSKTRLLRECWADCKIGDAVLASAVPDWSTDDEERKMVLEPGRLLRARTSPSAPVRVFVFRLERPDEDSRQPLVWTRIA